MADRPFERTIVNLREKPLSPDQNQQQSQIDRAIREILQHAYAARASISSQAESPVSGFFGNGFFVAPAASPDMTVTVKAGLGFFYDVSDTPTAIDSIVGLDDRSPYKPLTLIADQVITVPTADGTNPRIDIVEVKPYRRTENPLTKKILNTGTGSFDDTVVDKTLSFSLDGTGTVNGAGALNYKTGTPGASPIAPAATAGYTKIAEVRVPAADTTIAANQIRDYRRLLWPGGVGRLSASWHVETAANVTALKINAPPGVRAAVSGTSETVSKLWIFAGRALASYAASYMGKGNGSPAWSGAFVDVAIGQITAGDIATLAAANPALDVAEGQDYLQFQFTYQKIGTSPDAGSVVANTGTLDAHVITEFSY